MRDRFRHLLREEPLFCKRCGTVTSHAIHAQKAFPLREAAPPHEPLFCVCATCQSAQMLASQELASTASPDSAFCKILGRGQLLAGEWVYVPGRPRPGHVKAIFRAPGLEHISISYDDGTEEKVSRQVGDGTRNDNDKFENYRLMPFQAGIARMGDRFFHVHREAFGKVVGLQFGSQSKLVLQLENEVLLLVTLPPAQQLAPNQETTRALQAHCQLLLEGDLPGGVKVDVAQGMAYMSGTVRDLATRDRILSTCQSFPGLRAVVDLVHVRPDIEVADERLEERIHVLLASKGLPIIRGNIQCKEGVLGISGYYRHESLPSELRTLLGQEPLRELELDLVHRPAEDPTDKSRSQTVNQALRKYSRGNGSHVRATVLDGVVYLEGYVHSNLQKNQAMLTAVLAVRNLRIENRLRVVRPSAP